MDQSGGGGVVAPGVLYRKKCTLVAVASELKESTLVAGGWLRSRGLCLDEVPLVGAVPERVNATGGGGGRRGTWTCERCGATPSPERSSALVRVEGVHGYLAHKKPLRI